jgi:hypothetical protein
LITNKYFSSPFAFKSAESVFEPPSMNVSLRQKSDLPEPRINIKMKNHNSVARTREQELAAKNVAPHSEGN